MTEKKEKRPIIEGTDLLIETKLVEFDIGDIEVGQSGRFFVKDDEISKSAMDSICSVSGVPPKFMNKCDISLKKSISDKFFTTGTKMYAEKTENLITNVSLKKIVPSFDVFNASREVLGDNFCKINIYSDGNGTISEFATKDLKSPQRDPKDETACGFRVHNDITLKNGSIISVSPFLLRLVCTNGLTEKTSSGNISVSAESFNDESSMKEIIRSSIDKSLSRGKDLLSKFVDTSLQKIEDPERLIHAICRENRINPKIESDLINMMPLIEGNTLYDVINIITLYSNEVENVGVKQRLQSLGGMITTGNEIHRCPNCQKVL